MVLLLIIKLKYFFIKGGNFDENNFANEHEFRIWIKSGGYGKVYMGKFLLFLIFMYINNIKFS